MADEPKKESKSARRYGKPVKGAKKKESPGTVDGMDSGAEKKAEATAGEKKGSPGVDKGGGAEPKRNEIAGTEQVPERHAREIKEMHHRHRKELEDMHARHTEEHGKVATRHATEMKQGVEPTV